MAENLEIKSFEELYSLPIGTVAVFTAKHDSPAFAKFGQEKYVAIMAPNDQSVRMDVDSVGVMVAIERTQPVVDGMALPSVSGRFLSITGRNVVYCIEEWSFRHLVVERLDPVKYVALWLELFDMVRKVTSAVHCPQRVLL